jgi:hypothetical protein
MTELIVESIKLKGGGKGPYRVTEFDSPGQTNNPKYFDLGKLAGKTTTLKFSYLEDGIVKDVETEIEIDKFATNLDVYNFIIQELKKYF